MSESTHNMGSPTKFKDEFVHLAYIACSEGGFTDEKLAKLFSVAKSTINLWKKARPEFYDALRRGKDEYDCEKVEAALNKRAVGFRFTETHRELSTVLDPDTPDLTPQEILDGVKPKTIQKLIITKKIGKLIPPDAKAAEFWLCNRNPDRWRKLKHVEVTGKDGENLLGSQPVNQILAALEKAGGTKYIEEILESLARYDASNNQP